VERWSKRKSSFIATAIAAAWLLFFYPVWHWLWSLKPEGVWAAVVVVGVLPLVAWYVHERADLEMWRHRGPIRTSVATLAWLLLVFFTTSHEAGAWGWLASFGPLTVWAAVAGMILLILPTSWLISNYISK
jgi:hypothetical protein